jgi:glycerol kinase|tara:strand:- start:206 stop:343 length:138 start_codon:yes stop_codon:yes gene_type:complete
MCKTYTLGKPVYEYMFWDDPEPIKICQKCAKREHGSRNKRPLPEL